MKTFTDSDTGSVPNYPRIFLDGTSDLVDAPLPWQNAGLQQTATGYGRKLTTRHKINFNGKLYRIYSTCISNSASLWLTAKGKKIFVS